ncbi:FAD-dependent oxidoreductase [Tunturiibacter gelidiferens]|uniref:FAD-dependent oxidoreductase n=1 Tax=Tunturiibacter gelidiferens TaxID=3069689 RepID=UPI003D9AFCA6
MISGSIDYGQFLKRWFAVGDELPGVFILGCYARYVTIYSQQMRALNLVGALVHEKKLQAGTRVGIVGGGVGGLTAALAAQRCGATVTLIEKSQGLVGFQSVCKDRWVHPHIYDWPEQGSEEPSAGLPILNWTADYAHRVVNEQFRAFRESVRAEEEKIAKHCNIGDVAIENGAPTLTSQQNGGFRKPFELVIIAVGFGLEPRTESRWSYWHGDELDFLTARDDRWLIVGSGDSALTDSLRLCIHDFRHAHLLELLPSGEEMDSIKRDLLEIERRGLDGKSLTAAYENLQVADLASALEGKLHARVGKEVCITTSDESSLFNPPASVLNRFLLRLLLEKKLVTHIEHYEKMEYLPNEWSGRRLVKKQSFLVKFGGQDPRVFDRVLERFGPDSAITSFKELYDKSDSLRKNWVGLRSELDESRQRRWPVGLFGAETEVLPRELGRDIGIQAKSFTVTRQVLSDGRSYLTLALDGLTVEKGLLRGIWIRLKALAGEVGAPEPDQWAQQLGARWVADEQEPIPEDEDLQQRLEVAKVRASEISGVLMFNSPVNRFSGPIRVGVRVAMLNSVALSSWQFDQFYREDERKHLDGSELENTEYVARCVWFPVETFKLQLELPPKFTQDPEVQALPVCLQDPAP